MKDETLTKGNKMMNNVVYAPMTNTDLYDGDGKQYAYAICKTYSTAKRVGKSRYIKGSDCPVIEIDVIELGGKEYIPLELLNVLTPNAEDCYAEEDNRKLIAEEKKSLIFFKK